MPAKKTVTKAMSDDHKAALAQGRQLGRNVRSYLEALDATSPKQAGPERLRPLALSCEGWSRRSPARTRFGGLG